MILVREVAKIFGFQRKGPTVEMQIKKGIGVLLKSNLANRTSESMIVMI